MRLFNIHAVAAPILAAAVPILLPAPSAFAQTVYRCGSSYSQVPCPAGTAIEVDDARSAGQQKQTRTAAKRDAKLADDMEKTRLKQEAMAAPALVVGSKSQSAGKPGKAAGKGTGKKKGQKKIPGDFTATDGKVKPATKKNKSS